MSTRIDKIIFRNIRDANLKYNMIASGDRVAVAMSGGKDSLCLLHMLLQLIQYSPLRFDIVPINIDLGWNNDLSSIDKYCSDLGCPLVSEATNIGEVVFESREESNPCSLCSNLRRGALHRVAKFQGCNKVAMGHHLDDLVATFFMSMLYESRIHIYRPISYLDRSDLYLIRPLAYVEQKHIISFISAHGLNPVKNNCPADGITARHQSGNIVEWLERQHPGAKRRIMSSIEKLNDPGIYSR